MDRDEVRAHWQSLAATYGEDLRATTKTRTIKEIEIDALVRAVHSAFDDEAALDILEVGCGNGLNCLAVASAFPQSRIQGVDFIPEMVASAEVLAAERGLSERLQFAQGDVLELSATPGLATAYDVLFTVRCLINLPERAMQMAAVAAMADLLKPGGSLILLENNTSTYENQNRLREGAGLAPRVPDAYNCFMDQDQLLAHAEGLGLALVSIEDFASLHDIVLYVLVPAVNGGKVDYSHPLVAAATQVQLASAELPGGAGAGLFGPFGQNRLYHWRKP